MVVTQLGVFFTVHLQPRDLPSGCVDQIPRVVLRSERRRRGRRHLGRPVRASVSRNRAPERPAPDSAQRRLRRPGQHPLKKPSKNSKRVENGEKEREKWREREREEDVPRV